MVNYLSPQFLISDIDTYLMVTCCVFIQFCPNLYQVELL